MINARMVYLHLIERLFIVLLCSSLLDPCYHENCLCVVNTGVLSLGPGTTLPLAVYSET